MISDATLNSLVGRIVVRAEISIGWFLTLFFDFAPESSGDFLWVQQAAWRICDVEGLVFSCIDLEGQDGAEVVASMLVGQELTGIELGNLDVALRFGDSRRLEVFALDSDRSSNWSAFVGTMAGGPAGNGMEWELRST